MTSYLESEDIPPLARSRPNGYTVGMSRTFMSFFCVVAAAALLGACARETNQAGAPSATALEATLLAPCCFGGTLDVHDSEIARALRVEIESRVSRGESTAVVQADLVGRYGSNILANRSVNAFTYMVEAAFCLMALALMGVLLKMRSWRTNLRGPRSGSSPVSPPTADRPHDDYDQRLDDELSEIDR